MRMVLGRRVAAARKWRGGNIARVQLRQLSQLTRNGARTKYGLALGLSRTADYGLYARTVPVTDYSRLRPWVMRMVGGERDVLWPGVCRRFAQSSGTSDGRSKYIPVTPASLRLNHYRGATDAVAHYLSNYPDSRMFSGKGFILGGSFATQLTGIRAGVRVGDLSAHLIEAVNPLVNLVRVPARRIALMEDWTAKVPALVASSRQRHITNISGVPSWFLTVLRSVMADAGAQTIHDVWPDLEVFFHGGIAMTPYRSQYDAITRPGKMRYVETYNASEGFFAVQDLREAGSMLLLLDVGVFYEFIPLDETGEPYPAGAVGAWQVEQGKTYALVITAPNGLWRYPIGDTVTIVSADPLRIRIAGRTRHYINAFGEEVMVFNTDAALTEATARHHCQALNYTVAPVFAAGGHRGRHEWLIEWTTPPADPGAFAADLDTALQGQNSDYAAKRSGGIFLDNLTVVNARPGLFDRWLGATGKLGGQRKVPRLSNDRTLMDTLLRLNSTI